MAQDLNLATEILQAPTIRERDGLALSSRNERLSPSERQQAPALRAALLAISERHAQGERSVRSLLAVGEEKIARYAPLAALDYLEIADAHSLEPLRRDGQTPTDRSAVCLIAARFPSARLIDNILLPKK